MSRTKLSACFGCGVLQNTDKHTVKNMNGYSPVFCEAVFGTVLVPGTGVQPYRYTMHFLKEQITGFAQNHCPKSTFSHILTEDGGEVDLHYEPLVMREVGAEQ